MPNADRHERAAADIRFLRDDLVHLLSSLRGELWDASSLCEGWAVRDVVAHLIRLEAYIRSPLRYAFAVVGKGLRPNRFQEFDAQRLAASLAPRRLVRSLAEARYEKSWVWRHHPWPQMTVAELVIHGQDIRRPLGLQHEISSDQLRAVADVIVRHVPRVFRYPLGGWSLPSLHFEATDANWSWGSGPTVRGPLEAIVMTLAGRRQAASDLSGHVSGMKTESPIDDEL